MVLISIQWYRNTAMTKGARIPGENIPFPYSQFSGISKEFAETAFYEPVGTKKVVKVANSQYAGYHYIEVLNQSNMQPAYDVAYVSKPIEASTETIMLSVQPHLSSLLIAEIRLHSMQMQRNWVKHLYLPKT